MTLRLDGVNCYYGEVQVLRDVSLAVEAGEILGLLGRNGAGKTTTLPDDHGAPAPAAPVGSRWTARTSAGLPPHEIPRRGIAWIPQGRRLFPYLTVEENLRMGLLVRDGGAETLEPVLELFPVLRERLRQRAKTLIGRRAADAGHGARALRRAPAFLLMDEPTEGLMPTLVDRLLETISELKARGVGVLLVEQKVDAVLAVADRVVLIENGRTVREATPAELAARPELLLQHVGVRR